MSAKIFGLLTLVLAGALWATVSTAQQEDTAKHEGSVSCEVRGVSAASIDEGQHQRLAGVVGLPNEGDDVVIRYSLEDERLWGAVQFYVFPRPADENGSMISAFMRQSEGENIVNRENDGHLAIEALNTQFSVTRGDTVYLRTLRSALQLRRYYKADWQGIYVRYGFAKELAYIATLRCQQSQDALSAFSEQLIDVFGKD